MSELKVKLDEAEPINFKHREIDENQINKEMKKILFDFNMTFSSYPSTKTIYELFEEQVDTAPNNIALVQGNEKITYKELDSKANIIANYLLKQYENKEENIVAVLQEQSIKMIISIFGILKAGFAFLCIDPILPEQRQKYMMEEAEVRVILSTKNHIRILNKLQWECKSVRTFICIDSLNIYEENEEDFNPLMDKNLWDYVGEKSEDSASRGGWKSSFTGELFTQDELKECSNNVCAKLKSYINKDTRILEIGCSSGITMFNIAPLAGLYYGTDISDVILEETRKQVKEEGHLNIKLQALAAHEIDKLEEKDFDIIIFNSVIQAFHGHNYFRQIISKVTNLLKDNGLIFIGDVMDQDSKEAMINDLMDFERDYKNHPYVTKTDFSNELFLSRDFFEDLLIDQDSLKNCTISKKIHSIENELTKYRYDVILEIDKNNPQKNTYKKKKEQHGFKELKKYSNRRVYNKVKSNNLAYVIFTSGTSGQPKGVMVEHKALVNMCTWYNNCHFITAEDKTTKFANSGFDASIMEIFPVLIKGASIYILDDEVKGDLNKLNEFFEENKITICFLPTKYCEQFMELENNSLRLVNTGGEKLKKFIKRKYSLVDNYGPTECTVVSSYYIVDKQYNNIPVGRPIANSRIYILDKNKQLLPPEAAGEIYIAGDGLARGYLNRPNLSAEKFMKDPFFKGQRMYKTGDIGRFLLDGNIEFLGRADNQVKIRGYRIELGEIESRLITIPNINEAVVLVHKINEENVLCAYITANDEISIDEIKDYLSKHIPKYMIPTYFNIIESMPLTPNGKVNKNALLMPEIYSKRTTEFIGPLSEIEERLSKVWREVLGVLNIGVYDDFFDLGGNSLKVLKAAVDISKEFQIELSAAELFKSKTIKAQSELIGKCNKEIYNSIKAVERKEYYKASPAQRSLFVVQQMESQNTAYNIPFIFSVNGLVNVEKLKSSFNKVIRKHEILRTDFHIINGTVMQRVIDKLEIDIEYDELNHKSYDELVEDFVRSFDLTSAPLLRIKLVKVKAKEHLLILDIHHIILDGSSTEVLWKEIAKAYNDEELSKLKITYKDYAEWLSTETVQADIKNQSKYWLKVLSGEIPTLNLPLDYERPAFRSFEGDVFSFSINSEITKKLQKFARAKNVSMNMLLLAVYKIMLSKYSGIDDIIVGTPVYGRNHADLKNVIGMFVNTLALRSCPKGEKSFINYLEEMKYILISALDNMEYPFEELVKKINIPRDAGRNPIFDTMFVMQKFDLDNLELKGLEVERINENFTKARFDMTWFAELKDNKVNIDIEYCTDLFKRESIERISSHYQRIIEQIIKNPNLLISEIELITEEEKEILLNKFNSIKTYSNNKHAHEIFEEIVQKNKEKIALIIDDASMTYDSLNKGANKVASYLRKNGVRQGTIVALAASRSFEMIIGLLGILKSGGACLPINLEYPHKYINEILDNSGAEFVLKHTISENEDLSINKNKKLNIDDQKFKVININDELISKEEDLNLQSISTPDDVLYIIYTSGTSGKSKGVIIENRNFINLINYMQKETNIDLNAVLQFASLSFDVSFQEIFSCLLSGGRLLLINESDRRDVSALLRKIRKVQINSLFLPPAFLQLIFSEEEYIKEFPPSVNHIICAGEELLISKSLREYAVNNKIFIHNHYGPSETHVVTALTLNPADKIPDKPSIGIPISNRAIYIVGKNSELLPIGTAGELCISGEALGGGYLNNKELTSIKFQKNKFNKNQKCYRSGDLARWLPDGNIEFLGRIDEMIKIRGFRIEPGAIEGVLLNYDGIKKAIITLIEHRKNKYLCAYILSEIKLSIKDLKDFLSKQLPDYMVPAYFVFLSELPLNLNGKVDKKALPNPINLKGKDDFHWNEKSLTSIQEKLMKIWKEVLEIDNMNVDENFFELGGHSLKAIILMFKIKKEFKKELPDSIIFKYSTARKLAEILEDDSKNVNFTHLVKISEKGEKKIFCIHPAPGTIICYYELAKHLESNWSVYGLQAKGLENGQIPHDSIEEMAFDYIKEIKEVQQNGPYTLLGWSVGGRVAYEIAQQLTRQGDKVELLAILDTDPNFIAKPNYKPKALPLFIYGFFAMFTHGRIIYKNLNITSFGIRNLYKRLKMWVSLVRTIKKYKPVPYIGTGKVFLLQTKDGEKIESKLKDKHRSIKNFILNLDVVPIKGKHLEMFSEPNIRNICKIVKRYLD